MLSPLHPVADLVDHTGAVAPGDGGQLQGNQLLQGAGSQLPVDGIDAGRRDADTDLTGSGVGVGGLLDHQALRSAVFVEPGCAHSGLPYFDGPE
ncbi:hypothetical protein GCM10020254_84320 [Streptomyces goshikiensis]